jgi:NitT/TauT family transport system permease protein
MKTRGTGGTEQRTGGAYRLLAHAAAITVFLVLWELTARSMSPLFLAGPLAVGKQLLEWVTTGVLARHLGYTLYEILLGFLMGAAGGLLLGFLLGQFPVLGRNLEPYVMALYGIPRTALAPLFILWFGIGVSSKVAQAALMVLFMVFFNTYAGMRNVDSQLVNVVRLMGGSPAQVLAKVRIPAALPFIMTGLKVSIPQALIGAVVAEFISSNRGIGYLIVRATSQFDTAGVFAGIVVLAVVVYLLNLGLDWLERVVSRRQKSAPGNQMAA